jgi:hypothetical protein
MAKGIELALQNATVVANDLKMALLSYWKGLEKFLHRLEYPRSLHPFPSHMSLRLNS